MSEFNPFVVDDAVEILVVADRSGSMTPIKDDAIGGFNTFLEEQKNVEGEANLTLILFDHEYKVAVDSQNVRNVEPLNGSTFTPRGSTALNDAIGRAVNTLKEKNPEKAIICILTDGMENASFEYKTGQIKELIKEVEDKGWQVVYLAANQDSFAEGLARGISTTFDYSATGVGIRAAYMNTSNTVTAYRTGNDSSNAEDNT